MHLREVFIPLQRSTSTHSQRGIYRLKFSIAKKIPQKSKIRKRWLGEPKNSLNYTFQL